MKFRFFILGLILFMGIGIMGKAAKAASLGISSSVDAFTVGDAFSVRAIVSSSDQSLNAVSGVVIISETLEISSIDSAGSVVRFWTREPIVKKNQVQFEGVVLNPGFKGNGGRILTIRLRAKTAGQGAISFSSGVVLANDGKGTKLPVTLGTLNVTIKKTDESVPSVKTASKVPEKIEVDLTPFSILEAAPWVITTSSDPVSVASQENFPEAARGSWLDHVNGWWAGLAALFIPISVGLARLGGARFGFVAAIRRRRKVRSMENRIFELLLQWEENLERQYTRLKRAAKQRDLTVAEKQILRDIEKNRIRMHELGDLITDLPKGKKGRV